MSPEPATKVCDACGVQFGCGVNLDSCWCSELTLSPAMAAALKSTYGDCLCSGCLQSFAAMSATIVTYPDGGTEIVHDAVRVDTQNFHEGMFDFYDKRGNLLKQISMNSDIKWECLTSDTK